MAGRCIPLYIRQSETPEPTMVSEQIEGWFALEHHRPIISYNTILYHREKTSPSKGLC